MLYKEDLAVARELARRAQEARLAAESASQALRAQLDSVRRQEAAYEAGREPFNDAMDGLGEAVLEFGETADEIEEQLLASLEGDQKELFERYVQVRDDIEVTLQDMTLRSLARLTQAEVVIKSQQVALETVPQVIETYDITTTLQAETISAYEETSSKGWLTKLWEGISSPIGVGIIVVGGALIAGGGS